MSDPVKKPGSKTDTVVGTLLVALVVSLVCSSLVASAAVVLKPRQVANAILDMRRNILEVAGLMDPDRDVDELFDGIEPRVVDLETGAYVEDIDPEAFDPGGSRQGPRAERRGANRNRCRPGRPSRPACPRVPGAPGR